MRRSGYVRIDVGEIIDEIDDGDLVDEVKRRKLAIDTDAPTMEMVQEAYEELRRGRPAEALSILDRLVLPKWKTSDAAKKAYDDMFRSATRQ